MSIAFLSGCAAREVAHASQLPATSTEDQSRLDRCAARIIPPELRTRVCARVLPSNDAGAFAWRDGRIFVTRGLVELLDDDELCAAIAHELGHLSAGQPKDQMNSLVAQGDIEPEADRAGVGFLRKSSIDLHAMVRMLTKLEGAPRLPVSLRKGIEGRIQIVKSQLKYSYSD